MHPITNDVIRALRVPHDTVIDFVVLFSRFEYALKAAGFRKDPPAPTADVSWDKFKVFLDSAPLPDISIVIQTGQYLIDHPPKTLVVEQGTPDWVVPVRDGQSDIRFLVEGLVRARNNLFHGSKWLTPPNLPDRNEQVLSTALGVLDSLLQVPACRLIRQEFETIP